MPATLADDSADNEGARLGTEENMVTFDANDEALMIEWEQELLATDFFEWSPRSVDGWWEPITFEDFT
eukprot:12290878-Karenia_brevis.AAC.1